jgi:hypothetical protein
MSLSGVGVLGEFFDGIENALRMATTVKDEDDMNARDAKTVCDFDLSPASSPQDVSGFLNFGLQVASVFLLGSRGWHR